MNLFESNQNSISENKIRLIIFRLKLLIPAFTLSGMFCGEPMTYETLVVYGGELIAIPESTVVGCSCEQNSDRNSLRIPLPSALLTKF